MPKCPTLCTCSARLGSSTQSTRDQPSLVSIAAPPTHRTPAPHTPPAPRTCSARLRSSTQYSRHQPSLVSSATCASLCGCHAAWCTTSPGREANNCGSRSCKLQRRTRGGGGRGRGAEPGAGSESGGGDDDGSSAPP
eukprot:365512-Chlamydomonas_euryale.AAC.5